MRRPSGSGFGTGGVARNALSRRHVHSYGRCQRGLLVDLDDATLCGFRGRGRSPANLALLLTNQDRQIRSNGARSHNARAARLIG
jgi:hypothetical protein